MLPLLTDLELLALVGMIDPPRPAAAASIATAKSAGIRVRMITGDHAVTAAVIARQLGIDGAVITGAEFAGMTDDGVNDAPALRRADIGIAMGIAGTEVAKESAVMILTDDDFSTIVKAVELGRGVYGSLTSYVRFQMGCLFGYIIAFLGASAFDVAAGFPLLPLQTLW